MASRVRLSAVLSMTCAGALGAIRDNVRNGTMPPWHADPANGTWANDRSMAALEKETRTTSARQQHQGVA